MPQMKDAGFQLLKTYEGCILSAYDDANDHIVSPGDVVHGTLTIGYGHTGTDVFPGLIWTQAEADQALINDATVTANQITPHITAIAQLSDNQFSAFVCFAFNIGVGGFAGSSALHLANTNQATAVPAAIMLWDKTTINGHLVVSVGLQRRRQAECDLWNS